MIERLESFRMDDLFFPTLKVLSTRTLACTVLALAAGAVSNALLADERTYRSAKWGEAADSFRFKSATEGSQHVYLFPSASEARREGFVRVINHSAEAGEVQIDPVDDGGRRFDTITLAIDANETVHFNSGDLEMGNERKGLSGSTGAGEGNWRLAFSSGLDIEVLAYIRTEDGFLTAMHDVVPIDGDVHRVAIFNPGSNRNQESLLRLINPGEGTAEVTIAGIDDKGAAGTSAVRIAVPAESSRTIGAWDLESGADDLDGALGDGAGKWQLAVESDRPVVVMSLLRSPTGHLTNLSTAPFRGALGGAVQEMQAPEAVFRQSISSPIVQSKCVNCHVEGGASGNTRLVFATAANPEHETVNLQVFRDFLNEVDDGVSYILNKIQGVSHGGGIQVEAGSKDYSNMERFLRLLDEDAESAAVTQ